MNEDKQYTETIQMKYSDGDVCGRVRPAILLRYVQDVASKHATFLGVSREFNESHNMVFLLAKQAIEYNRIPHAAETLTFVTQPEQAKRATFRRLTLVYDAMGQEVACVDSIWVLVDLSTNRLLRRSPVPFDTEWAEQIDRGIEMRIQKTDNLQDCGARMATYSLCDENGHINNANYFDFVCDLLPVDELRSREIKQMRINYHREVRLGESVQMQMGKTAEGYYVIGKKDGLTAFEAFCGF